MEERTIELTVISATDLKKVVKFGKQSCYAVAYIYPKQKKQTKKDSSNGTDPSWSEKLVLLCDEQQLLGGRLVITVELYSDGTFSDKLIGSVTIPISDIAKDTIVKEVKEAKEGEEKEEKVKGKEDEAQYLAFEVRRPSGKAKGVLNAAIKFGEKRTIQVYQSQPPQGAYGYDQRNGQSSSSPQVPYPATGYPPAPGYPNQYAPQSYGAPGYPNQYPPQQVPYYAQQPGPYYPQQPQPYYQQQPPPRRGGGGGMGLGLGAGLLGGALGGLLVADAIDDMGDDGGDMDF